MKYNLIEHLEIISRLMELHGENPFKIKAYKKAVDIIYDMEVKANEFDKIIWEDIKGIGSSLSQTIKQFVEEGNSKVCELYLKTTPPGVLEMVLSIRGLTVRRVSILWKEYGVEDVSDLLARCESNQIAVLKGFGEKLQEKMIERIGFYLDHKGLKLYSKVIAIVNSLVEQLKRQFPEKMFVLTGELRRQLPVISKIEIVNDGQIPEVEQFLTNRGFRFMEIIDEGRVYSHDFYGTLIIYYSSLNCFGTTLFRTSCSKDFLTKFKVVPIVEKEEEIFRVNGLNFLPPFLRETPKQCEFLEERVKNCIQLQDIKGLIHCHSRWSDGENTIEEMAKMAIQQGLEYMVITDHSKSSVVANGLNESRIKMQHEEIDELNKKLLPFKIFKGIECDVLHSGEMDYGGGDFLSCFDFVIASIHQQLEMTKEQATTRMLKAITNPFVDMVGHSSGRLLLNRKGYDLDYELIFDACQKYEVGIELNANPFRLDIDWSYLDEIIERGIMTSINPDAHSLLGIKDIQYGVLVAQKGALQAIENLSSFSLLKFENYLQIRRLRKQNNYLKRRL